MKKEEILEILKECNIQSYKVYDNSTMSVFCREITWKELEKLIKNILYIEEFGGFIRINLELERHQHE